MHIEGLEAGAPATRRSECVRIWGDLGLSMLIHIAEGVLRREGYARPYFEVDPPSVVTIPMFIRSWRASPAGGTGGPNEGGCLGNRLLEVARLRGGQL